jgi:predicted enzyme related to lactoylglutathione lyase
MVAFECEDLDAMVERVKQSGATVKMDIMDTPVCRFTIVADPDGNSVMLHKRRSG